MTACLTFPHLGLLWHLLTACMPGSEGLLGSAGACEELVPHPSE